MAKYEWYPIEIDPELPRIVERWTITEVPEEYPEKTYKAYLERYVDPSRGLVSGALYFMKLDLVYKFTNQKLSNYNLILERYLDDFFRRGAEKIRKSKEKRDV